MRALRHGERGFEVSGGGSRSHAGNRTNRGADRTSAASTAIRPTQNANCARAVSPSNVSTSLPGAWLLFCTESIHLGMVTVLNQADTM